MCSQQSKGAKYPQKSFNCADAFSIKITRFHAALKPIFRSLKPFQAFSSLLNLGARDFSFYMNTHTRKPQYLLFENVPGLLNHDGGRTFAAILDTLDGLGYGVEWQVLNSKDFDVPQARRRVYIVGYLDARCAEKYYLSEKQMTQLLPRSATERRETGCTTPQA